MVLPEIALTFAFEKVGEALLSGIDAQLNPGEVEGFLKQALQAAHRAEDKLFYFSFQKEGVQGYDKFLNQFFKGAARGELQKPLAGQGKPDVAVLCAALEQAVQGHSKLKDIDTNRIQPWMTVFVETYFRETHRYLEFQVIKADYCDQIRRVFDDVKFAGIAVEGQDIDRAERLAEIFVMPDVREEEAAVRELPEELATQLEDAPEMIPFLADRQQKLLWEQRQQILQAKDRTGGRTFSAADLLTQCKTHRAVLLGAPGSGKTTLMNYFAVVGTTQTSKIAEESDESKTLQGKLNLPIATCIPIIIRIRDLARHPELSILEFVQDFAKRDLVVTRNLTGFFEYHLENGNALVLLDGLDEVAERAQRYRVVEKIEAFLNQFEQCPAIITSRPAGYQRDFFHTDEYPHYELQLFDETKIDTFIEHWYNSRFELESERERRKTSLRKALKDQGRIRQLARNPLLLTIIALIHRYQATLPKERYKLYDKAVETLFTTWDSQKELSNHEVLEYLELDDLRRLMERLAYWIHCQGGTGDTEGGTLIDREELIGQLTQYIREMKRVERYQAKEEAKRFLEQIVRDRAGLLSLQGQDRYGRI
jgi:predicted NACHT family NTPase